MPNSNIKIVFIAFLLVAATLTSASANRVVVVYTSVDQIFSEPILKAFEKETSIDVRAVYDVEASKTVGLEKRLVAEKRRPRADVFWNSEYLRTIRLEKAGVLAPLPSETVASVPAAYRSPGGHWAGFGVRARVFVVNTDLVPPEKMPRKLEDLTQPEWKGKVAVAKPYFGTTSTHFAALYVKWGEEKYVRFLKALKKNKVALLPGNSNVRDAVARGRYAFGLTDTDDVNVALDRNMPVKMIYPDQDTDGAFAIFHTVAGISGAPHPDAARKLIDYLASAAVESALIRSGAVQMRVFPGDSQQNDPVLWHIVSDEILDALEPSAGLVREFLE